eukprot:scaffold69548_cov18-Tisochrysis_lutea.AAC.3
MAPCAHRIQVQQLKSSVRVLGQRDGRSKDYLAEQTTPCCLSFGSRAKPEGRGGFSYHILAVRYFFGLLCSQQQLWIALDQLCAPITKHCHPQQLHFGSAISFACSILNSSWIAIDQLCTPYRSHCHPPAGSRAEPHSDSPRTHFPLAAAAPAAALAAAGPRPLPPP